MTGNMILLKKTSNLFLHIQKLYLDIDITETDTIIAPSVFSQASKLKKSTEVSLVLPPAENMVSLWNFKEYEASGVTREHDSLKTKSSRRNSLPRGQFWGFDRPPMKWYNISPQPHAVAAPKLQDAFRNIMSSQFQMPSAISAPWKQFTLWETDRENINALNHIFGSIQPIARPQKKWRNSLPSLSLLRMRLISIMPLSMCRSAFSWRLQ